jgi:hypothetical protein
MTKSLLAEPINATFLLQKIKHSSSSAVVSTINTINIYQKLGKVQKTLASELVERAKLSAVGRWTYPVRGGNVKVFLLSVCQSSKVLCVELSLSSTVWSN